MKYYNRAIEPVLDKMVGNFPAVMILGPRQTGKSTLLKYMASQRKIILNYVTLDNVAIAGKANEAPEEFLSAYARPLVIDEFQYAPNITSYVKIEIDRARENALFGNKKPVGTPFYLTGSRIFDTKERIRESLAGRVGILNLYTFTAREIEGKPYSVFTPEFATLKTRQPTTHLGERKLYGRIMRGGYPELLNQKSLDTELFFSSYLQTYIERDIRKEIRPSNEYAFLRFLRLLAARTGKQLVLNNIVGEVGIDLKTAQSWLSILQATGLIYLLRPFYKNDVKRLTKKPKIYFTDTGLACYLAGYPTLDGLINSAFKGQIFETYAVMEILKSFANAGIDINMGEFYYYRTTDDKKEIDLILNIENIYYPIEIKSSSAVNADDASAFNELEKLALPVGNGLVIYTGHDILPLSKNNYALPVEYI